MHTGVYENINTIKKGSLHINMFCLTSRLQLGYGASDGGDL